MEQPFIITQAGSRKYSRHANSRVCAAAYHLVRFLIIGSCAHDLFLVVGVVPWRRLPPLHIIGLINEAALEPLWSFAWQVSAQCPATVYKRPESTASDRGRRRPKSWGCGPPLAASRLPGETEPGRIASLCHRPGPGHPAQRQGAAPEAGRWARLRATVRGPDERGVMVNRSAGEASGLSTLARHPIPIL